VELAFPGAPFWNEICLKLARPATEIIQRARKADLHVGVDVSSRVNGQNLLLLSFTDRHGPAELDKLLAFFKAEFPGQKAKQTAPAIPAYALRKGGVDLPKIPVKQIKEYYDALGEQNVSPDDNIYALGSCTMKYNPYINDWAAGLPGFAELHPECPPEDAQGSLEILYLTQEYFKAITGLPAVTTQPMAARRASWWASSCSRLTTATTANILATSFSSRVPPTAPTPRPPPWRVMMQPISSSSKPTLRGR